MSILPRLALLGALALHWPSAWAEEAPASAAVVVSEAAHPSAAAPAPASDAAPAAGPTEPFLVGADKISGGDTAWMLTSTALVLMMCVPGLALFYGGMVRNGSPRANKVINRGSGTLMAAAAVAVAVR